MTQKTILNQNDITDIVGEVGEHLSNIYLGKDNPRRQEFVGRLEETVRLQLSKTLFATVHDVEIENVMTASEALQDSPGSDKPMTPLLTRQALDRMSGSEGEVSETGLPVQVCNGYFEDSKSMGGYDVTVDPAAQGQDHSATVDYRHMTVDRHEAIKTAYEQVRRDICKCSWNPDRHADDCPVAILERAIYL